MKVCSTAGLQTKLLTARRSPLAACLMAAVWNPLGFSPLPPLTPDTSGVPQPQAFKKWLRYWARDDFAAWYAAQVEQWRLEDLRLDDAAARADPAVRARRSALVKAQILVYEQLYLAARDRADALYAAEYGRMGP